MTVNKFTKQMQDMLPQWMKMAKDPESVGAKFLDVFGVEFNEVQTYLDSVMSNQFIGTADVGQIDIIYKVPLALAVVLDMVELDEVVAHKGDEEHYFTLSATLREFYANTEENRALLDREAGLVYLRPSPLLTEGELLLNPFDDVYVNGTKHYEINIHHVWNAFDEFGLLLGVERLFGEKNAKFKERILDVFRKPGNSTKDGLINAISRELGLEKEEVILNEFSDKAFRGSLIDETNGRPTQKLISYVERVNKVFGFTWDNMAWGEAYWRSIEETQMGLEYLPHIWDAPSENWSPEQFQSGVGDEDDLLIQAPKDESSTRDFNYYVGVKGITNGTEEINPEIDFKYKITARGMVLNEDYKPEVYKYTVIASEIVDLHFRIRAFKRYLFTNEVSLDTTIAGYQYDDPQNPSLEIVDGNENLSKTNSTYKYYKVIAELETASKLETPVLHDLTVRWEDTSGVKRDKVFTSLTDFTTDVPGTNGNIVNVEMSDLIATDNGDLELGFGDFYYMIDTDGSFREGTKSTTVEFVRTGSVRLNLPNN